MPTHRLTAITIGVPNVRETATYYEDFGLERISETAFATADGGEQLRIEYAPRRRLLEVGIGVDDRDDLDRVASQLERLDLEATDLGDSISCAEPVAGIKTTVSVAPRIVQTSDATPYNGPGQVRRPNCRAPGVIDESPVRPRKLGHVVIGSVDAPATQRFFVEGIGFKVSDEVRDQAAFLRCTQDHHNLLVAQAPVNFLHHSSWQVADVDEIGRGAMAMLDGHPERHVWGLGRHYVGSNFFWYLKDPAGNFSEYYSDMDCIVDEALWKPGVFEGARALFGWGPPPSPSFIEPEDLAAMMAGSHSPE